MMPKHTEKIICLILTCLLLAGCVSCAPAGGAASSTSEGAPSCSREIFAMNTYMTVTAYGENAQEAVDAAEEEILRLDALLSTGNEDSEISRLNRNGSAELSSDSQAMFEKALQLYDETDGAFDITIYPVMELWGFTAQDPAVPDPDELAKTLEPVGSDKLEYQDGSVTLSPGQGIDLGGIAKGYTSDRLAEIFAEYGLTGGVISLGGNVQLYGSKPDGSLWRCGIKDPMDPDSGKLLGVLKADECAVVTSGAYERFFTGADGRTYHHIIDPSTGYPSDSGLISATIVAKSGMLADGLSTAVFVMGLERAAQFWRSGAEDFEMILMTDEKEVYVTEGLEGAFSTDCPLHVIKPE